MLVVFLCFFLPLFFIFSFLPLHLSFPLPLPPPPPPPNRFGRRTSILLYSSPTRPTRLLPLRSQLSILCSPPEHGSGSNVRELPIPLRLSTIITTLRFRLHPSPRWPNSLPLTKNPSTTLRRPPYLNPRPPRNAPALRFAGSLFSHLRINI